jgi:hypothetical protein
LDSTRASITASIPQADSARSTATIARSIEQSPGLIPSPVAITDVGKCELQTITNLLSLRAQDAPFACYMEPDENCITSRNCRRLIRIFGIDTRFIFCQLSHLWRVETPYAQSLSHDPVFFPPYLRPLYKPDNGQGELPESDTYIDYYDNEDDYTLQLPPDQYLSEKATPLTRNQLPSRGYNLMSEGLVKLMIGSSKQSVLTLHMQPPLVWTAQSQSKRLQSPTSRDPP